MEAWSERQSPVVYFCGTGKVKNVWYRVNLESDGKDKRKKIYPVGVSTSFTNGGLGVRDGSWAIVGDDIYWLAGNTANLGWQRVLLKHDASDPYDPSCWALESRARILPRAMPFVAAIGKKLYTVGGTENDHPKVDWSKGVGEIYDIESKTWEYLRTPDLNPNCLTIVVVKDDGETNPNCLGNSDTGKAAIVVKDDGETNPNCLSDAAVVVNDDGETNPNCLSDAAVVVKDDGGTNPNCLGDAAVVVNDDGETKPNCLAGYDTRKAAVVVKDDGETTGVVFYSFFEGSMLFMDLPSGEYHTYEGHDSFALWNRPWLRHPGGLEDCEDDIDILCHVTRNFRAVFKNDTFYWFGYDMRFYGYDINRRRWFRSPSLSDKLGTVKPSMGSLECPNCPVLVGLPNGKFVVIVTEEPGQLTMALLEVITEDENLSVSVEYTRAYSLDYPSFVPVEGMAIMKNTGTSEQVQICNGDQIAGA